MIKYVYAIISSENDYIVEQALVSMYSLKKHNPEADITLVSDGKTFKTFNGERARIKEYINEVIIENPPEHYCATEKSRFLKTSLRRLVTGDFLYLDNDTIITGSLKELENFTGDLGAIKDHHQDAIKNNIMIHGQISNYLAITKKSFWGNPQYFNGGVFLARDTEATHKFFDDWHKIWKEEREKFGIKIDQPALAQANELNNHLIEEISGIYNNQFLLSTGKPLLFNSKVFHYFANSPLAKYFPLNKKECLKLIRDQGISDEINEIITNPLKAFLNSSVILCGDEIDKYTSPIVVLARILATKHKWSQHIARFLFWLKGLTM